MKPGYHSFVFRRKMKPELALDLEDLEPSGDAIVTPTLGLVCHMFDEFGLAHELDDDGDLAVPWENFTLYFFFYGERDEIVQARMYLSRRYEFDTRPTLVLLTDEWNRTKLGPKAFTVLSEEGMVGICAEHFYDFDSGVTRSQLKYTLGSWLHSMIEFGEWMDQQLL